MIIKKILMCAVFCSFMLSHSVMSEEGGMNPELLDQIEEKTLQPFFNALKSGDVEVLKSIMGGAMYEESRWSLEENMEYPDFLRRHYKDAVFSVEGGYISDNQIVVDVGIEFPAIGKKVTQFFLQELAPGEESGSLGQQVTSEERSWLIIEQRVEAAR